MAILKIARMGHPVLLNPAKPVENPLAPEIQTLLANMVHTLDDAGGVGLAAPQVYESLRLFIFHVPPSRAEDDQAIPLNAIINPTLTPLSDEQELGWEGCLSIPGLRAAVPRFKHINVKALDSKGAAINRDFSGFAARVIQHETDHLDGLLYPMRMTDFRYFGFTEETLRHPLPLPGETI